MHVEQSMKSLPYPLSSQVLLAPCFSRPRIAPGLQRSRTCSLPWKLMQLHLDALFHDLTIPISCLSYLLSKDHLSEDTAQLILAQNIDRKQWEILLASLEKHEHQGESFQCFKEALSYAEQTNLLHRIEEALHRHSDSYRLTVPNPASNTNLPMPFSISFGWKCPATQGETASGEY